METWGNELGVVELPDGRRIRGTGRLMERGDIQPPDFAVYLLGEHPGERPWELRWVKWRDFGKPSSTEDTLAALREAHDRAATERVEISCDGGTGRTGTALATIAILAGVPKADAVVWVRENYRPRAVETLGQRRWVLGLPAE